MAEQSTRHLVDPGLLPLFDRMPPFEPTCEILPILRRAFGDRPGRTAGFRRREGISMYSKALASVTSVLAIAWAGTANAQAATTPDAAPQTSQAPSALPQEPQSAPGTAQGQPTTLSAAGPGDSGSDIIVTAQRRSERLVDVPISIATVSAADLERVGPESIENLTRAVPGVYLQREVYGLSPTIRGIGSTLGTSGGEQNVATYIDGVYQPTASGNIFDLASVSDVEVLKGPQGTLFGRNATGGAILLKTLDPGFTRAGRFNVSFERFNEVRSSAYVDLPLSDTLAINGAVAYLHSPGYIRDNRTGALVDEARNFTARGKLLFQPTDRLSILVSASHADLDDPSGSDYQSVARAPAFLLPGVDAGPIATDRYHLSHDTQDVIRTATDEYTAHIKLDLDFGTLTSITAYQRNTLFSINDLDSTYATIPAPITLPPPYPPIVVGVIPTNQSVTLEVDTKTVTQEVNLTRSGHPLTYVVGFYYFHNEARVPFLLSNASPLLHAHGHGEAFAGYADATYRFGKVGIIAGLRYSHETRTGENGQNASDPTPFTRFQNATDNKFTPRAGLRYSLSGRSNLYATYSKGFKSGVFDLTTPTGPAVKPETVDAYEAGFKTAARVFSLNVAGFYYDYRDTQVNSTVSGQSGAIFTQLLNVPRSRIYGADIDATLRLSDAFDLRAAFAYTHARYVDFPSAPGYTNSPANAGTVFGLIYANVVVDASGNHMVRAPDYTASGTVRYHAQIDDRDRLDVTVTPYYSSRVYFDFANTLSQAGYFTLDAAASLTIDKNMKMSVFGRNLTDNGYRIGIGQNALGINQTFAKPRTYGVSLGYSF